MVALRKESVDRNMLCLLFPAVAGVALRKESVDRNTSPARGSVRPTGSLSARRAWIEMWGSIRDTCACCVALRKESVDRNQKLAPYFLLFKVALRKESVDRNSCWLLA